MRAVIQRRYGSGDDLVIEDVASPVAADDEVVVRVRAASLHPDVWHVLTGRPWLVRVMGAGLFRPKCHIPGTDIAGVVESVGRGVTALQPGDAVFGETITRHQWISGGAFAEFVAVRATSLAIKPVSVTFAEAASVPTSGMIALSNLRDVDRTGPGRRVLINGAGGGVGSLALQIVKSRGAYVTAVDSAAKLDLLRSLGADEVIDFRREDFTRRGERYDLIFDVPGNHTYAECRRALVPDGRYVLIGHELFGAAGYGMFGMIPQFFALVLRSRFDERLRGPGTPVPDRATAIETLRTLLEAGHITPRIDSTWPLERIAEAVRHMAEDELLGKVIVTLTPGTNHQRRDSTAPAGDVPTP